MFLIKLTGLDEKGQVVKYWTKGYNEANGWLTFSTFSKSSGKEMAHFVPLRSVQEVLATDEIKEPEETDV